MEKNFDFGKNSLSEIIDNLPLAIIVCNDQREVSFANKRALRFIDRNEDSVNGQLVGDAFRCSTASNAPKGCDSSELCAKCVLKETVLETLSSGTSFHMLEILKSFEEKGERRLRVSTQPVVLEGKNAVLMSLEDISEEKRKETLHTENEKLQSAIHTAGAICHEMNQPLQVIATALGLVQMSIEPECDFAEEITEIEVQVKRLSKLVLKFMSLSRYKTKKYSETGVILDIEESTKIL